ncbi:Ribonuclease D [Planctomycetes bacterium Poly30]|uniref:Ribonuclease D n=1 Tax=Saltatorellus ferox TaxID=2528018 RepID=A0A518EYP0_9BACT|nr:Ribonuclease D [Planctomycetes bacterium Poly30]
MLIQDTESLTKFCASLQGAPYLAVDTEFMRESTYHAQLCLVQVAHGEHAAAIDPLARGIDLAPLHALLAEPGTLKVLHSAVQDLEIFFHATGSVPGPVFDTQIAASVCGLGDQPGYAKLAAELLGVQLDKASQAVDWSVRPMSERQIDYALGDVTHLCRIYEILVADLETKGRGAWVAQEMEALVEPSRYVVDPRLAYRRIKIRRPERKDLAILRELSDWRERAAVSRNIPRGWVVRDDALAEIAQHVPHDVEELARVRGLKPQVAKGVDGRAMLDAIERALATPEEEWPEAPTSRAPLSGHEPLVALLQALLRLRCDAHGVSTSMIASRNDLDRIATEPQPDVPALRGWRKKIFGEDALKLRAGEISLSGDGEFGVLLQ